MFEMKLKTKKCQMFNKYRDDKRVDNSPKKREKKLLYKTPTFDCQFMAAMLVINAH